MAEAEPENTLSIGCWSALTLFERLPAELLLLDEEEEDEAESSGPPTDGLLELSSLIRITYGLFGLLLFSSSDATGVVVIILSSSDDAVLVVTFL